MGSSFYRSIEHKSLQGHPLSRMTCQKILVSTKIDLFSLLNAAYNVRKRFWGKEVTIHVINNVQNGHCGEDCHYCAQSRFSKAPIKSYPMKSDAEILDEAKRAYRSGAFRYCMVFAGREQGRKRLERLTNIIRTIKKKYKIEVCVSPGFVNKAEALLLKKAGLDRLNHNINTSSKFYSRICTTHSFDQRLQTLRAAQEVGLDMCSGVIVGMGERAGDVIDAALTLRTFKNVKSIPVNFFLPIPGTNIPQTPRLSPEYCLRVLCLYRFLNPRSEIRMAAGREYHLRSMQVLGLYPANSLFMDGYLNVKGTSRLQTLQMILDAGFTIRSEQKIDALIRKEKACYNTRQTKSPFLAMKRIHDLCPSMSKECL